MPEPSHLPVYAIGIDLGTSNCALACARLDAPHATTRVLAIPQWERVDRQVSSSVLPSFAYCPDNAQRECFFGKDDAPDGVERDYVVGLCARDTAAEFPARVVYSAKSWLCHAGVNRRARILPWGSGEIEEDRKLSPVQASALYLAYLREVWQQHEAKANSAHDFNRQVITITVPASFDHAAQKLTLEAAELAGFPKQVRLIEEPQAAFHAWLEKASLATVRELFSVKKEINALVCDIGGGTSDFSLFRLRDNGTDFPEIERVAVSDHILLGGDNIDLALAHQIEQQLATPLNATTWQQLVTQARRIKEEALGADLLAPPADRAFTVAVTLAGGSSLFGNVRTVTLSGSTIRSIVDDGFFPFCPANAIPRETASGLREMGLPYAQDTAITRHLASFLRQRPVDVLLCNGGTVTPLYLRQRLARLLGDWQQGATVTLLENEELHLAVARGAALFGRHGFLNDGKRIGGGSGHGVYLEIQASKKEEQQHLVCVIPQGTEVEKTQHISKQNFQLQLNRPVQFKPFTTTRRDRDHAGQIVRHNPRDFTPLPPLQTVARMEAVHVKKLGRESAQVEIEARLNALGLLQLFVVTKEKALQPPQRWELEFNLRALTQSALEEDTTFNLAPEVLAACMEKLAGNFTPSLLKDLETLLHKRRGEWPPGLLRRFWEPLAANITRRSLSPDYETTWLNAAGYFLRPGFGDAVDDFRIEQLWSLQTLELAHPKSKSVREQAAILWRRVSGGLSAEQQSHLYRQARELIATNSKQAAEAIRMAGAFERLPRNEKLDLWEILLRSLTANTDANREHLFWAMGRLLNRAPLYGGVDTILEPAIVQQTYDAMKAWDWTAPGLELMQPLWRLAARLTNHRTVDLPLPLRQEIHQRLVEAHGEVSSLRQIIEYQPLKQADTTLIFGESLPPGLSLRGE
ncbi:MAG: Hsp70 family protein [Verrucomicrobiota bacterium]|nr:Hsp70 family protein [Verrucomicrobiota bacterium]